MNWQDHIVTDPTIRHGKACVKGARFPLDSLLQTCVTVALVVFRLTMGVADVAAEGAPPTTAVVQFADDFESGTLRRELWQTRRQAHSVVAVALGPTGSQAAHVRSRSGNVELVTRPRFENRRLVVRFRFVQAKEENSGYAGVVRFSSAYHFWWLEWMPPKMGLWTTSGGGWACRWTTTGLRCDKIYQVRVENRPDGVRVRVEDAEQHVVADSGWQPHDDGPPGALAFGAHTGGGVRGIWIDDVAITGRREPPPRFLGPAAKRNTAGAIALTSAALAATFSRDHGWPLTFTKNRTDLFGKGLAGGFLREFRQGTYHHYSDGDFHLRAARRRGNRLTVTQQTSDGKFATETSYELTADALRWEMRVSTTARETSELSVGVKIPVADWVERFFVPTAGAPFTRENVPVSFAYRDPLNGSAIPLLTLYSPQRDRGLSVIAAPTVRQPALTFTCNPAPPDPQVLVMLRHVAVAPGRPVRFVVYLAAHRGDWRPGLDWLQKRFPDYFRPQTRVVEGHQLISGLLSDQRSRQLHDWGFRWVESHFIRCAFYGKFIGDQNTPEELRKVDAYMRAARKRDWHSYVYWSFMETRPDFAQQFPDSISRSPDGKPHLLGWNKFAWMVPSPGSVWQTYILRQLSRLLDALPDVDGVFCDNTLHHTFSYGQRDGLSMVGGKECAQFAFAQHDTLWKAKDRLLSAHKGLWANGACDLQTARYLDGILVEGISLYLQSQQYLGLHKPLVFITYYNKNDPDRAAKLEYNLKRALVCGSLLGFNEWELKPGVIPLDLLRRYLPLFERLRERRWVLSPHPLTLPAGVEGNVFRVPGGYTVCLASFAEKDASSGNSPPPSRLHLTLHLPRLRAVRRVTFCAPSTGGRWSPVRVRNSTSRLLVSVPWEGTAAAVFVENRK